MRGLAAALIAACALVAASAGAEAPTGRELYLGAISAMNGLPQPPYVTFHFEGVPGGMQIGLTQDARGVWLRMKNGNTPTAWDIRHRTFDYQSEIVDRSDGKRYVSGRSFFDPTWYGAIRALSQGMLYSQDHAAPRVTETPPPATDGVLRAIGVVSTLGTNIYGIEDRGDAACPNGNPGRALHLVSRTRNRGHQLSDVTVELASKRFCMMRYGTSEAFGFHGIVEQHYDDVGGYWLQTDGLIDGTGRIFGLAINHGAWTYRLSDMQFPASLPPDTFASSLPRP